MGYDIEHWRREIRRRLSIEVSVEREAEIVEELAQDLAQRFEALSVGGSDPAAARQQVLAELADGQRLSSNLMRVERSAWSPVTVPEGAPTGAGLMTGCWQDIRYAIRSLARRPALTVAAVLTLGLGVGANTAIFSVANAVLLKPLPYPNPDRLAYVWTSEPARGLARGATSFPDFVDWEQNEVFEHLAAVTTGGQTLTGGDEPEFVQAATVSASFFSVLGVDIVQGRSFLPEDERWGQHQVVVISDALWQRRFGRDPALIGKPLQLNGEPVTVIGIAPAGFSFPNPQIALWSPLSLAADHGARGARNSRWLAPIIGRLRAGVTLGEADQRMKAAAARVADALPGTSGDVTAAVEGMAAGDTQSVRLALLLLVGAVVFVLTIACINVANLQLAQAVTRTREIAVRSALGASRTRLFRQVLTENIVLALLAGGFGLLLAFWGLRIIVAAAPSTIPRLGEARIDGPALAFTLAISLFTGMLFGVAPAFRMAQMKPQHALGDTTRGTVGGARSRRLFQALVVAEVALAVVLVIGATLLIRSFGDVLAVDPGFRADGVLAIQVRLPAAKYKGRAAATFDDLLMRLSTVSGVQATGAGALTAFPLVGGRQTTTFGREHEPVPTREEDKQRVSWRQVTPGYFQTLGIPLRAGRGFGDQDRPGSPAVAIVNEALVRRFFADSDPVGAGIWIDDELRLPLSVIGVAADARFSSLEEADQPAVYTSHPQETYSVWSSMWVALRTSTDPRSLLGPIRDQVKSIDRDLPIARIITMEEVVDEAVADRRFTMYLLGTLALVALMLAAIGIYGVMAHSVTQRTGEMGLRLAIGASSGNVLALILRQGLLLAAAGSVLGIMAALAMTQAMSNFLFGISPTDGVTFVAVPLVLTTVTMLACYVPARRASRIDPVAALRGD